MQKKEILSLILDSFLSNREQPAGTVAELHDFCAYATKWLADRGVVGVGHSNSGLALRFSDGEEAPLFVVQQEEPINLPAVSITGNSGGSVRGAGAVADNSVKITG